jgi:hypothetical protein
MPLVRSQSAKFLSLWQSRQPVTQGNVALLLGRRKSGFGIAVALVLADSLFGTPRAFPQTPDSPEKAPDSARSLTRNAIWRSTKGERG